MESPRVLRWETLTKKQFDAIDRAEAVVLVTCSPLEVHGPHLPLGADCLEGEGLAERMLRFLPERHRARTFLKLPFVYAASDPVPQPGSLAFRPSTTIAVLRGPRPLARRAGLPQRAGLELPRQPAPLPRARGRLRPRVARARHPDGLHLLGDALAPERRRLGARRRARPPAGRREGATSRATRTAGWSRPRSCWRSTRTWVDPRLQVAAAPHRRALAGRSAARRGRGRAGKLAAIGADARVVRAPASASSPRRPTRARPARRRPSSASGSSTRWRARPASPVAQLLDGELPEAEWHSPVWKLRHLFTNPAAVRFVDAWLGVPKTIR